MSSTRHKSLVAISLTLILMSLAATAAITDIPVTEEATTTTLPVTVVQAESNQSPAGRALFNPRIDNNEWLPVGRGDPLKNDPTYDYSPPVLDRVRYWGENNKDKNDILLLGVASKRPSFKKESKFNSPIRRNFYPAQSSYMQLPTILMPPPMVSATSRPTNTEVYHSQGMNVKQTVGTWPRGSVTDVSPEESNNYVNIARPNANLIQNNPNLTPHHTMKINSDSSSDIQVMSAGFKVDNQREEASGGQQKKPWLHALLQKEVSFSKPNTAGQSSQMKDEGNSPIIRVMSTQFHMNESPKMEYSINNNRGKAEVSNQNLASSQYTMNDDPYKFHVNEDTKPHTQMNEGMHPQFSMSVVSNPHDFQMDNQPQPFKLNDAHNSHHFQMNNSPNYNMNGASDFNEPTKPQTLTQMKNEKVEGSHGQMTMHYAPAIFEAQSTSVVNTIANTIPTGKAPPKMAEPTMQLDTTTHFTPTIPPATMTTDELFSHYKQPSQPVRGPMYLIIQGHSKVKTYGLKNNETVKMAPKIVPIAASADPVRKRVVLKDEQGEALMVKHLHKKAEIGKEVKKQEKKSTMESLLSILDTSFGNLLTEDDQDKVKTKDVTIENKENLTIREKSSNSTRKERSVDFSQADLKETHLQASFQVQDTEAATSTELYRKGIVESEARPPRYSQPDVS